MASLPFKQPHPCFARMGHLFGGARTDLRDAQREHTAVYSCRICYGSYRVAARTFHSGRQLRNNLLSTLQGVRCSFLDQSCNVLRPGDVDRMAGA
jgi:hypothetical protein